MDDLFLPDAMQRYFHEYFAFCADEPSGKVALHKLIELIKSGNVPDDAVTQIAEICWSQNSSFVLRKQFCSALKLVAAYQSNVPIRSEILASDTIELTLPRFAFAQMEPPQRDLIQLRADDVVSTDSEIDSETLSIGRAESVSASSTASDSPTPTNSVQERSWAMSTWQGLVAEEQRQLLATEEESSDRHSSEEDGELPTDVWVITAEQREYYKTQFTSLQPDTNALLAGGVARMFFEKSRLPVHELRKIWQLADVTKDGALSLDEFSIAMHLVVLRRNHIELPEALPVQLRAPKDAAKEWTKFVDSPTNSMASPGPKPVNFDFQKGALEMDPKILHPVALRLTPEVLNDKDEEDGKRGDVERTTSAIQRPQPKKFAVPGPGAIPPPPCDGPVSLPATKKEKPPPPPPRPFKTHGRSSSLDLNKLNKHLAPPTIPPRISPNVAQRGGKKMLVNQRSEDCHVQKEAHFADFDLFEKYENVPDEIFRGDHYEAERKKLFAQFSVNSETSHDANDGPRRHGAFEIYRKPTTKTRESSPAVEDRAKSELFVKLQEQNTVLLRFCQELSQELAEIKVEKVALKLKLEKQLDAQCKQDEKRFQ